MSTRNQLLSNLTGHGVPVVHHADNTLGLPQALLRHQDDHGHVITVGGDAETGVKVGALVDGLAWIAASDPSTGPLTVRIGASDNPIQDDGVIHALHTLQSAYFDPGRIVIQREDPLGHFVTSPWPPAEFHNDARLPKWNSYLQDWYQARPAGFAHDVVAGDDTGTQRLYPQLVKSAKNPTWSLRMDGLEIAMVTSAGGEFRIGRKLTSSKDTQAWNTVAGGHKVRVLAAGLGGVGQARDLVHRLRDVFGVNKAGLVMHGQPEHSFESALLRGTGELVIDGRPLELPNAQEGRRQRVAWGSQIPTLWWAGGNARYLDALMRSGSTPWAVELKVPGSSGYGRYLRQGLTQAVIYRHFLTRATALHPWVKDSLGLQLGQFGAVLAIPTPLPTLPVKTHRRIEGTATMCQAFGVTFATVPATGL